MSRPSAAFSSTPPMPPTRCRRRSGSRSSRSSCATGSPSAPPRLGERLKAGLLALQQRYDCIGDVRGRGLLLGLDLVKDRRTRAPDPELAQRVARECLALGMMTSVVRGGFGIFRIAPPLTIEADEIDLGLEIFDRALARSVH